MPRALLIVDVQNDFMSSGALPVPRGDEVIPAIDSIVSDFDIVVATQDWHPADHMSFAKNHPGKKPGDTIALESGNQILWPVHCVQNTIGAAFAKGLDLHHVDQVIKKGQNPLIDSYSGFFDNNHLQETGLDGYFRAKNVDHLVICGLATDYCVYYTALDALLLSFRVDIFVPGCRGVHPVQSKNALVDLESKGAALFFTWPALR